MKRLFALWLALLCIGQASAETIAQQVGAPEKIAFECESASGRTHVYVDAEGIFRLVYDYPAEIKAPLAQDVGLLPFEQIMSVFERIVPLSIASAERGENNMLSIDRITLGYMGTPMKDEPSRYQLIPVWDFFGTRSVSGEVYSQYLEPLITINAMDGTVIDRKYGY